MPENVHAAILIVDDDQSTAGFYREELLEAGFEVGTAHSAEETLALAGRGSFDIMFLEVLVLEFEYVVRPDNEIEYIKRLETVEAFLRKVREHWPRIIPAALTLAKEEDRTWLPSTLPFFEKPIVTPFKLPDLARELLAGRN